MLPWLKNSNKKSAQGLFRDVCFFNDPRWKVSIQFVTPLVPYIVCDPIVDSIIILWDTAVRGASFGCYYETADQPRNTEERRWIHVSSSF